MAAVVILLHHPNRRRLLAAYLGAGMLLSIGLGLAIVSAMKSSGAFQTGSSTLSWTADLALGGLALLAAWGLSARVDERLLARRRARRPAPPPDPGREPWSQRILARGTTP